MSKNIDENIVELKFDNSNFEKNVQTSMSTLEKLKQKLNFSGANTAIDQLATSAKKLTFDVACQSAEKLQVGFSTLGVVGINVISNITQSLIGMATQVVNVVTGLSAMKSGFEEYQLQMGSIQTIMSNTSSKGTTLSEVNDALDELNTYADLTIYNFGQMTKNIGTFTAAGVDLETSVASIKGIANLAAASGSSSLQASTAMYQLSQAIAAGKVQLMDWNSVVNAGMGGELFQNALKRTAEHFGTDVDGMIEKYGSFRESLTSGGWLTVDVLTETLKQISGAYTESDLLAQGYSEDQAKAITQLATTAENAATKVKTFAELWDVIGEEAGSGWTKTWSLIFGDYEYAKENLTWFANYFQTAIGNMSNARNSVLEEGLESNWDRLLDQIKEAGYSTSDFTNLVEKNLESQGYDVDELKVQWGTLENMLKQGVVPAESLTTAINELQGACTDLADVTIGLTWGSGFTDDGTVDSVKKVQTVLKNLGYDLGTFGDNADGVDGQLGDMTQAAITAFQAAQGLEQTGIVDEATLAALEEASNQTESLTGKVEQYIDAIDELGGRDRIWQGVKNVIKAVAKVAESAKKAFQNIFPSITSDNIFDACTAFEEFTEKLIISDETADKLQRVFEGLFGIAHTLAVLVGGPLKAAFAIVTTVCSLFGVNVLDVIAAFGDLVKTVTGGIKSFLKLDAVQKAAEALYNGFKTVLENIKKLFTGEWTGSLTDIFTPLVDGVKNFAEGIGNAISETPLAGVIDWVSGIVDSITTAAAQVASNIDLSAIVDAVKDFLGLDEGKGIGIDFLQGFIDGISTLVQNAIDAVKEWAGDVLTKVKEVFDIHSPSGEMRDVGENFIQGFIEGVGNKLTEAKDTVINFASDILDNVKNFFSGFSISSLAPIVLLGAVIAGIIALFKNLKGAVLDKIGEPLDKVKEAIEGLGDKETKADALEKKSKAFRNIAISIGILVAAVIVLGKALNDPSINIGAACAIIAGIGAFILIVYWLMSLIGNKLPTDSSVKLEGVSASLGALALVIAVMAACIWALGQMNPEQLSQGTSTMIAIVVLVVLMVAAMVLLADMQKGMSGLSGISSSLSGFAVVIAAISACVWVLGQMSEDQLAQGLDAIYKIAALVAAFILLSGYAGKLASSGKNVGAASVSISGMASLLVVMAACVWVLGTMNSDQLAQGIFSVTWLMLLLAAFVLVIGYANKLGGAKAAAVELKGVAGLLVVMAACVVVLGGMSNAELSKGLLAVTWLVALMAGFIALLSLIQKKLGPAVAVTVPVLLALAACLAIMTICVVALSMIDEDALARGVAAFTVIGVLMAAIIAVGSKCTAAMPVLIVMIVLFAVIALCVGALATFTDADAVIKVCEGLEKVFIGIAALVAVCVLAGTNAAAAVVGGGVVLAFIGLLGLLLAGLAELAMYVISGMPETGANLTAFMDNVQGFITGAMNIPDGLADKISQLGAAIAIMGGAELVSAITSGLASLFGGGDDWDFASKLADLGKGLGDFGANVSDIDVTTFQAAADAAPSLTSVLSTLTKDAISASVVGDDDMDKYFMNFAKLGAALADFGANVEDIELVTFTVAACVAEKLANILTTLPTSGGFTEVIFGKSMSIDDFCGNIVELGEALAEFGSKVSDIKSSTFTSAATAATALGQLIQAIPAEGGITGFLFGSKNQGLEAFGDGAESLGTGLAAFANAASTIDVSQEQLDKVSSIVAALVDLQNAMPTTGGLVSMLFGSTQSFKDFTNNAVDLVTGLSNFATEANTNMVTIDQEKMDAITSAANALTSINDALPKTGGVFQAFTGETNMADFGTNAGVFASGLAIFARYADNFPEDINYDNLKSATNFLSDMGDVVGRDGGLVGAAIDWLAGETDYTAFHDNALAYASAILGFGNTVACMENDIPWENITNATTALAQMGQTVGSGNNTGNPIDNLVAWFTQTDQWDTFKTNASTYAEAICEFGSSLTDFECKANPESLSTAVECLVKMSEATGNNNSLFYDWDKSGTGENLKANLSSLGEGISGFASAISNVSDSGLTNAEDALEVMEKWGASEYLDTDFEAFGVNFASFGGKLGDFNGNIADIDTSRWETIGNALEKMNSNVSGISGITAISDDDIATFGDNVTKALSVDTGSAEDTFSGTGQVLMNNLTAGFSDNIGEFTDAADSACMSAMATIAGYAGQFTTAGNNIMLAVADGISGSAAVTSAMATAIQEACSSASSIASSQGQTIGYWLMQGFNQGIADMKSTINNTVSQVAASSTTTLKTALDINSPSRITRAIGHGFDEGLYMGIYDFAKYVDEASDSVANTAIDAISVANDAFDCSADYEPVIRPVVDLSNIQNGSKTIDSWLNFGSVSTVSAVMAERYSYASNDDIVSAIQGLSDDISNMPRNNYNVNGVTYDDGSSTARAVSDLTRAIKIRRRS